MHGNSDWPQVIKKVMLGYDTCNKKLLMQNVLPNY